MDYIYKGCGTLQIHEGGVAMIRILDRDDIDAFESNSCEFFESGKVFNKSEFVDK